jgi:hypothetical protein
MPDEDDDDDDSDDDGNNNNNNNNNNKIGKYVTNKTVEQRVLHERLTVRQPINFLHCMEDAGSLLRSQNHTICSYSEKDQVHALPYYLLNFHFNIILPSKPRSPRRFPSIRFPYQNPGHKIPVSDACFIHLPSHSY